MLEIGILGKKFIVDYITLLVGGLITISIITLAIFGRIFYYYKVQEGLGVLLSIGFTFFTLIGFVCAISFIGNLFNIFHGFKLDNRPKRKNYLDPWGDDENY